MNGRSWPPARTWARQESRRKAILRLSRPRTHCVWWRPSNSSRWQLDQVAVVHGEAEVAAAVAVGAVRGLGPRRWGDDPDNAGPFAAGGIFRAELWLDRSRADTLIEQSQRSHLWATIAAGLVAICTGLVWRATVKLANARGQARVYQTETRHLRELSQAAAGLRTRRAIRWV